MTAGLTQDIRWTFRYARRRPALALAVVATISLAIAAATTAFGLASAVLWRPLPFGDARQLMFVWEETERDGQPQASRVTGARHAAWRDAAGGGASLALFGAAGFTIDTAEGATSIRGVRTSANYFDVLGIQPVLGRTFTPSDEMPGRHQVIVLSNGLWQERFGGRREALGQRLRLNGEAYTVIGVMPAAAFPGWPINPAVVTLEPESRRFWVPIPRTPELDQNGRAHVFGVLARLGPASGPADLAERLNQTATATAPDPHRARVEPLRQQFVSSARTPLIVLAAAALAVLLIACANLAALYASAFESRRAELATRIAIGATSARLVRQIAIEVLLLAAAGTLAGTLLASFALGTVPRLLPASVPFLTVPAVDAQGIAFAALLGLLTIAIVSGWPIARLLFSGASIRGTASAARQPVYRLLVVAQIAIAVALTSAAGLLGRSLSSVEGQDPGFSIDRVLVADLGWPRQASMDPRRAAAAERQLLAAIATRPQVEAVAAAYDHPLEANWTESPTVLGDTTADVEQRQVDLRIVSPGYFDALGVELLAGRTLTDRDVFDAPGATVVNEAFARELGGRVVGRRVRTGTPAAMAQGAPREFTIVGVVANERFRGLERPAQAAFYLSTRQFPQSGLTLLVRTTGDPVIHASDIRSAVKTADETVTFDRVRTLETILAEQLVARRVTTEVIGGFAGVAVGLSALGMYGLLAMLVGSRTREIGIRLAVGASPSAVGQEILRYAVGNATIGILLGSALALGTGRLLHSLLVDVMPHDPLMLGLVAALLLTTAACAALFPALRAARIDPVDALRHQ
jgi:putative ABC transport system permease protein